jgi:hypothetical protein
MAVSVARHVASELCNVRMLGVYCCYQKNREPVKPYTLCVYNHCNYCVFAYVYIYVCICVCIAALDPIQSGSNPFHISTLHLLKVRSMSGSTKWPLFLRFQAKILYFPRA